MKTIKNEVAILLILLTSFLNVFVSYFFPLNITCLNLFRKTLLRQIEIMSQSKRKESKTNFLSSLFSLKKAYTIKKGEIAISNSYISR